MSKVNVTNPPVLSDFLVVCHNLPADEQEQVESMSGFKYDADATAAILFATRGAACWAVRDEANRTLIVAGAREESSGVWSTYFFARPEAWAEYGEETTAVANDLLLILFNNFGARRIEVRCLAKRTKARRWYEKHLKLQCEGVLRSLGANGEDVALYALVREG